MTKQVPVITDKKIGNTFNIYGNNIFDTFCEAKRMPGVNWTIGEYNLNKQNIPQLLSPNLVLNKIYVFLRNYSLRKLTD